MQGILLFTLAVAVSSSRVIVTFRTPSEASFPWNLTSLVGAHVQRQYGRRLVLEYDREFNASSDTEAILKAIENVLLVEPCGESSAASLWDKIDLGPYTMHTEAGRLAGEMGRPSTVVALLDSGISVAGRGMLWNYVPGYDFLSYLPTSVDGDGWDPDPTDPGDAGPTCTTSSWHGTSCASMIAANGVLGIWGAAPNITLLGLRTSGMCGSGNSDM